LRGLVEAVGDTEGQHAAVGDDRSGLVPDEPDLRAGQVAEDLVGADDVQGGQSGNGDDGDLHARSVTV